MTTTTITAGRWTRAERLCITGIVGVIAALHVMWMSLYLFHAECPAGAGAFAGAHACSDGSGSPRVLPAGARPWVYRCPPKPCLSSELVLSPARRSSRARQGFRGVTPMAGPVGWRSQAVASGCAGLR